MSSLAERRSAAASQSSGSRASAFPVASAVPLLLALALAGAAACAVAQPGFGFGQPATAQQIAAWDIDVRPDGTGLPRGRGTVAAGQAIYDAKCASCHGTFGESNDYMAIAGGVGTLASDQPIRTTGSKLNHATTLFDYIRRAMPFANPKSLTDDEVYALTAYVLHLSGILPADAGLDRESIVALRMPNRDGFTTDHGLMRRNGRPDTRNVACMKDCAGDVRVSSEIPAYARDSHGNLADQTRPIGGVRGVQTAAPAVAGARVATGGADLAKRSACMTCHALSGKSIGPAFTEIAGRYAGDRHAGERLAAKVRTGGAGAWGPVPMPAQAQVKEADAIALVRWILDGAP